MKESTLRFDTIKTKNDQFLLFICTKNLYLGNGILILKGDKVEMQEFDVDTMGVLCVESALCQDMEVSIDTQIFSEHFDLIRK